MKKIFFFSLIILFFLKTQNVFGNSDTFTVDNIEVVRTINDQNYKKIQLDTAFRKGFEKLISINFMKNRDIEDNYINVCNRMKMNIVSILSYSSIGC